MTLTSTAIVADFLVDLEKANTNSAVKSTATSALATIGFNTWIFACENVHSMFGRSQLLSGISLPWVAKYLAKGYIHIDPIVSHCRASEEPFFWDAMEGWESASEDVRELMQDIRSNGFGSGLALPLRSPKRTIGLLNIINPQPLSELRATYLQHAESAHSIGMAVFSAIERITC